MVIVVVVVVIVSRGYQSEGLVLCFSGQSDIVPQTLICRRTWLHRSKSHGYVMFRDRWSDRAAVRMKAKSRGIDASLLVVALRFDPTPRSS